MLGRKTQLPNRLWPGAGDALNLVALCRAEINLVALCRAEMVCSADLFEHTVWVTS